VLEGPTLVIVGEPAPIRIAWFVSPVKEVVTVFPDPVVVILPLPTTFIMFATGTAVPVFSTKDEGTDGGRFEAVTALKILLIYYPRF
jgi:hypothetical protein